MNQRFWDLFSDNYAENCLKWKHSDKKPVFGCGLKGAQDGGTIWFPTIFEEENNFAIIYEGSRGKYLWDLSSQICLSTIEK